MFFGDVGRLWVFVVVVGCSAEAIPIAKPNRAATYLT